MATALEHTPMNGVKTHLPERYRNPRPPAPLATFLGMFSIGLGLAEVLRPAKVAARTGVPYRGLLRAYGLREIAAGAGILASDRPAFWLWARVAGDVIDLATLAAAYAEVGEAGRRRAVEAAVAVAGVTALDVLCACEHTRGPG